MTAVERTLTSESFLRLADLLPDGLLLLAHDGEVLAANRPVLSWLNGTAAAVSGAMLSDLFEEDRDRIADLLRRVRRTRVWNLGSLALHGERRPCQAIALDSDHSQARLRILLRFPQQDLALNRFRVLNEKLEELGRAIRRREQAEQQLRDERDLAAFGRDVGIALGLEPSREAMLTRCVELMVERLNGAFARIWTLDPGDEELVLRASAGLYTHVDGDHARIPVGRFKIGQIALEQEPHLTNRVVGDPRVHNQEWAKTSGMVAFAGYPLVVDRRTVGVMGMFAQHPLSDGTLEAMGSVAQAIALGIDRKRVEAELAGYAFELQKADRRKDEFLAMLAHELRNPLAPIRSGLELLQRTSGDDRRISIMQQQVEHMTHLIDDLLDVSRIMRDRIALQRTPVSVASLLERAVATVEPLFEQSARVLSVTLPEREIWVEGDEVRLTQVLCNLLNNAIKYTAEDGTVSLTATLEAQDVVIRVQDDGAGISPEFLPEIFDLFTQSPRTLDRSLGGLGIGLTLARRLALMHGGDLTARSGGPGKGSEFELRLASCEAPSETNARIATPPATGTCRALRVLVVEDNVDSATMLREVLELLGDYTVEVAHDGHEALRVATSQRPDLVLLDIGLPGVDGYEIASRLRADQDLAGSWIVALTGYGSEHDRERGRAAGFDDHLLKPVGVEELERILALAATERN